MTWIRIIPPQEADQELRRIYETLRGLYPSEYHIENEALKRPDGSSDSIVAAHSLLPDAMLHVMSAHAALIQPAMPLTRRQQEMISTVVSALNSCFY
jgi:hypothetical protein